MSKQLLFDRGREETSSAQRNDASTQRAPVLGIDRWLTQRLLRFVGDPRLSFVLWDGSEVSGPPIDPLSSDSKGNSAAGAPGIRVSIHDRGTLWRLCLDPEWQFGEAFSQGRLEVEGDLVALVAASYRARPGRGMELVGRWLRRRPRTNTRAGSRENIHSHYDLGNDFYGLWLDRDMSYTCAYYADPSMTLEQAQQAKMEHVCRKLQLEPGERVVEAGSGWGALAVYMARHYGVRVVSYNISQEQVRYARQRLEREGLGSQVEFVEADYRDIEGEFDVFVSVGMLEHVGRERYSELGRLIDRVLTPEGRGLIHTIGRTRPQRLNAWIERRIFPGAYPPSLSQMGPIFEPNDFALLDVENLRPHYALTLRAWLERFDAASEGLVEHFDRRFVRAWRLYLAGSIAAFEVGSLQLFQVLFNRAASNRVPMTRAHLYTPEATEEASWRVATR